MPPEEIFRSTSEAAWSHKHVLQLQAMAGNTAVAGLLAGSGRSPGRSSQSTGAPVAARQIAGTRPRTAPSPATAFPWVGKIQTSYNAALRRDPSKDPNAPYDNIAADLPTGTLVEVTGWLKVEVIDPPGGRPQKGFVSTNWFTSSGTVPGRSRCPRTRCNG